METLKKIGFCALVVLGVMAVASRARRQFPIVDKVLG